MQEGIKKLIERTAELYGITPEDVLSKCRRRVFVDARKVVCYILMREYGLTYMDVGLIMGIHYTSALFNYRAAQLWLNEPRVNPEGAEIIKRLLEEFAVMNEKIDAAVKIAWKGASDILALPCVRSIEKSKDTMLVTLYNRQQGTIGDWIVREDGEWGIVTKDKITKL